MKGRLKRAWRATGNLLIKVGFAMNGRAVKQQVFRPGEYEALTSQQRSDLYGEIMDIISGESQMVASLVERRIQRVIANRQLGPT